MIGMYGQFQITKIGGKRFNLFVNDDWEIAVEMGQKLSETVKGKLSVGAKIIKNGGRENIFWQVFGKGEEEEKGEKLLKASQCYLSTTAGPIAGILFISTHKVAFCSERPITLPSSPSGILLRTPYKVFFLLPSFFFFFFFECITAFSFFL